MQAVAGSKPRVAGERMAASYANFYICNGGVVMPAFGGEAAEADERCVVRLGRPSDLAACLPTHPPACPPACMLACLPALDTCLIACCMCWLAGAGHFCASGGCPSPHR